jgi:hypothetical protein
VTGIPVRELFGVLEAAERWLAATGHPDWRAAILSERALTHRMLGETDAAVAAAEEALAVATQHPDAPGYTLNNHRYQLGDILRDARRAAEAAPHYQAILTDPDATPWERRAAHEGLAWCAGGRRPGCCPPGGPHRGAAGRIAGPATPQNAAGGSPTLRSRRLEAGIQVHDRSHGTFARPAPSGAVPRSRRRRTSLAVRAQ